MKDKRCGEKINQRRKEKGLKVDESVSYKTRIYASDLIRRCPQFISISQYMPSLTYYITTDYIFEITDEGGKDEQIISRINKLTPRQKDLLLHLLDSFNEFEQGDI